MSGSEFRRFNGAKRVRLSGWTWNSRVSKVLRRKESNTVMTRQGREEKIIGGQVSGGGGG